MPFRSLFRRGATAVALAVATVVFASASAGAEGWGTVKGQVVWAGGPVPKNPPANVDKDKAVCLARGPIHENKIVVDPKSKGVRWVLVWLADPQDATNAEFAPPVHPSLKNPRPVVIDQPCCLFEPRVIGIQAGQTLIVKNPATIGHNFDIRSLRKGPVQNKLMPPGTDLKINGFVANLIPTSFSCSIHPWMKGWIGTFAHPYFAVTDAQGNFEIKNAPAGKFQLVAWQEESGFLLQKDKKIRGKIIEIKAGGTTNVGKIGMKPESDED